jgi:hypothetical protein
VLAFSCLADRLTTRHCAGHNGANQEIKFCCPMCESRFLNDADNYMKKIKAAEDAQKK